MGYVDDDPSMAANSDHLVPSQKAMKSAMLGKEPAVSSGTSKQYYRGDKTWQTQKLVKTYTATISSGVAVIYLTDDGLVTGNALFSTVDYVHLDFTSNDPNFGKSYAITNSNKTLTITAVKQAFTGITLLSTPILGSVALAAAANGTTLSVLVQGDPA